MGFLWGLFWCTIVFLGWCYFVALCYRRGPYFVLLVVALSPLTLPQACYNGSHIVKSLSHEDIFSDNVLVDELEVFDLDTYWGQVLGSPAIVR